MTTTNTVSDKEATKKRSKLVCKVGNVGETPELRYTPGGKAVCNFHIAVNTKEPDGKINTEWYRITAWEQLASNVIESVSKGMRVMVYGVPSIETYERKDGQGEGKQKKINAWNVGVELSFATATVTRIERTGPDTQEYEEVDESF